MVIEYIQLSIYWCCAELDPLGEVNNARDSIGFPITPEHIRNY